MTQFQSLPLFNPNSLPECLAQEIVAALGDTCAGVWDGMPAHTPRDAVMEAAKEAKKATRLHDGHREKPFGPRCRFCFRVLFVVVVLFIPQQLEALGSQPR